MNPGKWSLNSKTTCITIKVAPDDFIMSEEFEFVPDIQNWPQSIDRTENILYCPECPKSFLTRSTLEIHQRMHANAKLFHCLFCKLKYKRADDLYHHQRAKHKDKYLQSSIGFQPLEGPSDREQPLSVDIDEKRFMCERCGMAFAKELYFQRHQQSCNSSKLFQCSICSMCFVTHTQLLHHRNARQCQSD